MVLTGASIIISGATPSVNLYAAEDMKGCLVEIYGNNRWGYLPAIAAIAKYHWFGICACWS